MTQRSSLHAALLALALALPGAVSADEEEPPGAVSVEEEEEAPSKAEQRKAQRFVPTGSVTIESTQLSLGVGVSWGKGILTFRNENHPFKTGGWNLVGIGGSSSKAQGTVFNLEEIEDFAGTWAQVSGSAVIGPQSSGGITLRNGNVFMTLSAEQKGAKLAAGGGAMTVRFTDVAAEAE